MFIRDGDKIRWNYTMFGVYLGKFFLQLIFVMKVLVSHWLIRKERSCECWLRSVTCVFILLQRKCAPLWLVFLDKLMYEVKELICDSKLTCWVEQSASFKSLMVDFELFLHHNLIRPVLNDFLRLLRAYVFLINVFTSAFLNNFAW